MTTLAEEAARQFGFNPNEPRGPGGKWKGLGRGLVDAAAGTAVQAKASESIEKSVKRLKGSHIVVHHDSGQSWEGVVKGLDKKRNEIHLEQTLHHLGGRKMLHKVPVDGIVKVTRS